MEERVRILVLSQYFYPEEFKVNDLVEGLVQRGHDVVVLTGKPNYPSGKFADGYKFWGVKHEEYKGAKVIRVPLIPRRSGGNKDLIINYFSFLFFAQWYVMTHKIEVDYVICHETSPIIQIYPAFWVKWRNKCKVSMWILDLWPESIVAAGRSYGNFVMKMLNSMVRGIYRRCDTLFVAAESFIDSINEKGDFSDKVVYAPNWAEDLFSNKTLIDAQKHKDIIPRGFIVMFAGNIGKAQDFDAIIKAANETRDVKDIKWVIVGDGRKRAEAEQQVKDLGIEDTVSFLGRYPLVEMPSFFVHADAMLVSLKDEYIFSLTIPAKTQAYMASGKPILTMINGVGNDVVNEAKCGLTANAGDYKQLADNVLKMYNMDKSALDEMGVNAETYYRTHFDKDEIIDRVLKYN